ncbi:hypothetical protein E2C01_010659 [Portunus trituberculatus]|uniref:Uncharacterized protein n=1 Tax=Portunus trituberculatus TaxID=210409 RepID=A0A5B7D9D4_PORTR|nr:hypothetical protein [Portunus trituberculatus]
MSPKTSRVMGDEEDTRGGGCCFGELDRIGMKGRRKPCAERPQEEGRHAVNKISRTVSMKIGIKNRKGCNISAVRKRLKTVSQRRGVDETKSFSEADANLEGSSASAENEAGTTIKSKLPAPPVFGSNDRSHVTETSATRRHRARRKAVASRLKNDSRRVASTEESQALDKTSVWPSPSVRVFGSDGRPFVTSWEEAAYNAFLTQQRY